MLMHPILVSNLSYWLVGTHGMNNSYEGLREMEGIDVIKDEVITVDPLQLLKHFFNFYVA
jgi:hypothetical protein